MLSSHQLWSLQETAQWQEPRVGSRWAQLPMGWEVLPGFVFAGLSSHGLGRGRQGQQPSREELARPKSSLNLPAVGKPPGERSAWALGQPGLGLLRGWNWGLPPSPILPHSLRQETC